MVHLSLSKEDEKQLSELGISREKIIDYLKLFEKNDWFVTLVRPCKVNDGIECINSTKENHYISLCEEEAQKGRMLKFVPASGAATRMFQCLWAILESNQVKTLEDLDLLIPDTIAKDAITFFKNIKNFAFYDLIETYCSRKGTSIEQYIKEGPIKELANIILHELGFANLPKGLIPFHKYNNKELRTPFEEHIIEAVGYVKDKDNICRLHFTIGEEYHAMFQQELNRIKRKLNNVILDVTFSYQSPSTHTIAVDMNNIPFRDEQNRLLFRPGGHGSLLKNLNEIKGDIIFIKNVDNVVPDNLKPLIIRWKKILAGVLIEIEREAHHLVKQLKKGKELKKAENFCHRYGIILPQNYVTKPPEEKITILYNLLNRPIRVCGMVRNLGAPGGGPFWTKNREHLESKQIIEKAQVNFNDSTQESIWKSSTHFNPVDIVCSVRDAHGNPFDLHKFKDPDAVIITEKHYHGKPIKVLEHPGLWNGSMAYWITVFVEVPLDTFHPVKKATDLLNPAHSAKN